MNLDVIIFAQEPKLGPVKADIRRNLARLLGLDVMAVNVKAKTGEGVGVIGRGWAMALPWFSSGLWIKVIKPARLAKWSSVFHSA